VKVSQISDSVSNTLTTKTMAVYIYSITKIEYGTPTGNNTLGSLTQLPNTVKGSVTIEETEGSSAKFNVDQLKEPIRVVKTEEGEFSLTAQFYDMTGTHLAAFKGGSGGSGAGFTPAVGYTTVEKGIKVTFDSGQVIEMYNAACLARYTGGGGRDKMLAWELKMIPQVTLDLSGSYKVI